MLPERQPAPLLHDQLASSGPTLQYLDQPQAVQGCPSQTRHGLSSSPVQPKQETLHPSPVHNLTPCLPGLCCDCTAMPASLEHALLVSWSSCGAAGLWLANHWDTCSHQWQCL